MAVSTFLLITPSFFLLTASFYPAYKSLAVETNSIYRAMFLCTLGASCSGYNQKPYPGGLTSFRAAVDGFVSSHNATCKINFLGGTGMYLFRHPFAVSSRWLSASVAIAMVAALILTGPTAKAQTSSANLDGTVLDASGAVVPGATVTLKNQASGDERTVTSNGEGYFNFSAILPATYTLTVTTAGFRDLAGEGADPQFGRSSRRPKHQTQDWRKG